MCYSLLTHCVCDDCGDDIKTFTTDKLCPSSTHCAERDRRPRRQEERVSNRLCDNCQKFTNRVYHGSRAPGTGRSRSRTETDRVHTIRTNDSHASAVRGDRRRRDSDSGDDSDATIRGRGRTDRRTESRRKFDSIVDKLWDSRDSTDSKDRSRGHHGRNRRDTVSSVTEDSPDPQDRSRGGHHRRHRRDTVSSVTEDSTDPKGRSRGGRHGRNQRDTVSSLTDNFSTMDTSDCNFFRSTRDFSFRPLESDQSTFSSSSTYRDTYRGSDSTYRGSDSTYRGGSESTYRSSDYLPSPSRLYEDSLPSSSSYYASTASIRGFTNIPSTSTTSRDNIIPLRNVLRQYGLDHDLISKMYKKCKGPTLALPSSFDDEYPNAKLYRTDMGEFYVDLHKRRS